MRIRTNLLKSFLVCLISAVNSTSYAAGDLTSQQPIVIKVILGDKENPYRYRPATINLETGHLYKLLLVNNSPLKHYYTSEAFANSIFTRKVQVVNRNGDTISEVKGVIRTVEVYPGQTTEWWFVPVKTGEFDDLHCSIKGHTEAGMTGKIIIR